MKLVMAKDGYRKVGDKYLLAKKCSKCSRWLIASTVNFYRKKGGKYGLEAQCKECRNKQHKQYCKNHREEITKYHKQWREANPEYDKQYYKDNKEKRFEIQKRYYQSPKGQASLFNKNQRRRAKEQQGDGITKDQWLEMMQYFDWKCAYSGEYIGGDSFNRTIDHIVPLDSGGDQEIWNLVPMTRSLNCSKQEKDMLEWYKGQSFYDPKRLAKIYEWQEYAYNKWGKDSERFNSGNIQIKLI